MPSSISCSQESLKPRNRLTLGTVYFRHPRMDLPLFKLANLKALLAASATARLADFILIMTIIFLFANAIISCNNNDALFAFVRRERLAERSFNFLVSAH